MVYDPQTPYTILQNSTIDFSTLQRINRFARYWDMVANSGRFSLGLSLLLGGGSAFNHFLAFSDWLWQTTGKTHEFALEKLLDLLHDHLVGVRGLLADAVRDALLADYRASGARGKPLCLAGLLAAQRVELDAKRDSRQDSRQKRQGRHVEQAGHQEEIRRAAAAA